MIPVRIPGRFVSLTFYEGAPTSVLSCSYGREMDVQRMNHLGEYVASLSCQ